MAQRLQLHSILKGLLGSDNVYFQPPPSIQLKYPCILYKKDTIDTDFADNYPYRHLTRYLVTVIDRNPDSEIPGKVGALQMCVFDRSYPADDLNHDVYKLFF